MRTGNPTHMDARTSMTALVSVGVASLLVDASTAAMGVLLCYVGALQAATSGLVSLLRRAVRLVPVVTLIVALNGAFVPGEPLISLGDRAVLTRAGVAGGAFFSLRFLVLYFAAVLFAAVIPPVEFARGVYSILRPLSRRLADGAAFYGFLVTSFLPLFTEEFERVRLAQSFRGAGFEGGLRRRVGAVRLLVAPLVLSAIHRSGQLAAVVELRGLRDRVGKARPGTRPGVRDAAFLTATAVVIAVAVVVGRIAAVHEVFR